MALGRYCLLSHIHLLFPVVYTVLYECYVCLVTICQWYLYVSHSVIVCERHLA